MFHLKNRQSNSLEMAIGLLQDNLKLNQMLEQKLNEWENKAVEIIKIVNGLTPTQINHIFSLVNHSVSQSPTQISFQRKSLVYQNEDKLNGGRLTVKQIFSEEERLSFAKEANDLLDKSIEENVFIHT